MARRRRRRAARNQPARSRSSARNSSGSSDRGGSMPPAGKRLQYVLDPRRIARGDDFADAVGGQRLARPSRTSARPRPRPPAPARRNHGASGRPRRRCRDSPRRGRHNCSNRRPARCSSPRCRDVRRRGAAHRRTARARSSRAAPWPDRDSGGSRQGLPLNKVGRPTTPSQRSRSTGWSITPSIGQPSITSAIKRTEDRPPGDEGAGAVDRIEHPGAPACPFADAIFLADDRIVGKACLDHRCASPVRRRGRRA